MINDPIGDTIVRIKNAQRSARKEVIIPFSNFRFAFLNLLLEEKRLQKVEKISEREVKVEIGDRQFNFFRVSRLGQKIYAKAKKIPRAKKIGGFVVVSTPSGLMSGKNAQIKKVGGEVIGEVN